MSDNENKEMIAAINRQTWTIIGILIALMVALFTAVAYLNDGLADRFEMGLQYTNERIDDTNGRVDTVRQDQLGHYHWHAGDAAANTQ